MIARPSCLERGIPDGGDLTAVKQRAPIVYLLRDSTSMRSPALQLRATEWRTNQLMVVFLRLAPTLMRCASCFEHLRSIVVLGPGTRTGWYAVRGRPLVSWILTSLSSRSNHLMRIRNT